MSAEFEEELRRARNQAIQAEIEGKNAAAEAERRWKIRLKEVEIERAKEAREVYERIIFPVKPMVDELMSALGNETWGKRSFKSGFYSDHTGYVGDGSLEIDEMVSPASWIVGRLKRRSLFGNEKPSVKKRIVGFCLVLGDKGFILKGDTEYKPHFPYSTKDDRYCALSEASLRDMLRKAFLERPLQYVEYYPYRNGKNFSETYGYVDPYDMRGGM